MYSESVLHKISISGTRMIRITVENFGSFASSSSPISETDIGRSVWIFVPINFDHRIPAKIRERIRGVAVPNSGSHADWNPEILHLSEGKDRMYWICGKHEITSQNVVSDIVLSSSNNRFLTVDDDRGCCFAGYLVPKEDMDRP